MLQKTQANAGGGGKYFKMGNVTIPNNTTDTVTLQFDEAITQFLAFKCAVSSNVYANPNGFITLNRTISALSHSFSSNWRATSAADSDSGLTLSADGKTLQLKQPRNYYSGEYIYFAWAD